MKLPLNPKWFRNKRPLILFATVEPWKAERGEEEIGDALYRLDSGLAIERRFNTVLLVYANVDPLRAFREVVRYPPAYVSRLLPVEAHVGRDIGELSALVKRLLEIHGVVDAVELEVRVRGNCINQNEIENTIQRLVTVRRRASWLLRIEFACPIGVMGIVEDRSDRLEYWRQRLNP